MSVFKAVTHALFGDGAITVHNIALIKIVVGQKACKDVRRRKSIKMAG